MAVQPQSLLEDGAPVMPADAEGREVSLWLSSLHGHHGPMSLSHSLGGV